MTEAFWDPAEFAFPAERLDEFLLWARDRGASDISFQTRQPAFVEIDGALRRATACVLDGPAMSRLADLVHGATAEGVLRSGKALDGSLAVPVDRTGSRRFRYNLAPVQAAEAFGINLTLRALPDAVPELADLGVDGEIASAWEDCRGLTLVTGVPGSGKSTLLAAGTRRLLERGAGRIQSYESPIEFAFDGIGGAGAQMSSSEIPKHFATFAEGLRSSLRRRPAAVIVGEARDRETVEAVVRAADFGIAVYSTAHTLGVASAIRRMIAEFPAEERAERGAALLDVLHLVVAQMLLPNPEGGRTAIREWLIFDAAFKARLMEAPPAEWAPRIARELENRGNGIARAAAGAHLDGRISDRDLGRVQALAPGTDP